MSRPRCRGGSDGIAPRGGKATGGPDMPWTQDSARTTTPTQTPRIGNRNKMCFQKRELFSRMIIIIDAGYLSVLLDGLNKNERTNNEERLILRTE